MDCRKSLVAALIVVSSAQGCIGPKPWSPPTEVPSPAPAEKEGPKKTPKAVTCVAFADFKSREAADPRVPAEVKPSLREHARVAYQQALQIDPQSLPALVGLARLASSEGDYSQSLATYDKALKLHPKEAGVWYEMGMCFSRQKQWDRACQHLDQAVVLAPENREYATTLAYCLARMGRYEESLVLFTRVVGKADAHYKVARMAHHLNQDEVSKELLRRALVDKPDFVAARKMLDRLEGRQPASPGSVTQVSCITKG